MSCIGIMGESGHGKTTAMQHLDPASTFILDADQKGLSWRGWKSQYNADKKNYAKTSNAAVIKKTLKGISDNAPHIKVVVIDTVNAIMVDDEMSRMKQKGYDKWVDLATSVYDLVRYSNEVRDDLTVILVFHCAKYTDDNTGETTVRILTNGRKLEKIQLETKLPILLYAKCKALKSRNEYIFETQANNSTAKSPLGMFESAEIPNDMLFVLKKIHDYEFGEEQETPFEVVTQEKSEDVEMFGERKNLSDADFDAHFTKDAKARGAIPQTMQQRCQAEYERAKGACPDIAKRYEEKDKSKWKTEDWQLACEWLIKSIYDAQEAAKRNAAVRESLIKQIDMAWEERGMLGKETRHGKRIMNSISAFFGEGVTDIEQVESVEDLEKYLAHENRRLDEENAAKQ